MTEPISRDIADLREWLVRIDTKVDYLNEVKRTADEAKQMSIDNKEEIHEMKSNTKWLWGTLISAAAIVAAIFYCDFTMNNTCNRLKFTVKYS